MKIQYITIEREYGSGGSKIAREAAKRCGIACYGSEILETVARNHNTSIETLQDYEEKVSSSFLYSMFVMSQSQTGDPDLLSHEAKLYVAETRVIKEFADRGPAIFVGHCASQALQDREGVLRVFIRANDADKERRITEDYGVDPQQVSAFCRKFNRKRANYYAFCTQKKWNDLNNYDLVLNSSTVSEDGCAAALAALYHNERKPRTADGDAR